MKLYSLPKIGRKRPAMYWYRKSILDINTELSELNNGTYIYIKNKFIINYKRIVCRIMVLIYESRTND